MTRSLELMVADCGSCWRGKLSVEMSGVLVAALSADPETWDELRYAVGRFFDGTDHEPDLGMQPTACAGLHALRKSELLRLDVVIDLPARMLLTRWNQSVDRIPAGRIGPKGPVGPLIDYSLGPNWWLGSDARDLHEQLAVRRQARLAAAAVDQRDVLYDAELIPFLVSRCQSFQPMAEASQSAEVAISGRTAPSAVASWTDIRRLRKEWLESRPEILQGKAVREVINHDSHHLGLDSMHRQAQWAHTGQQPLALRETDSAYLHAGFGPNEGVLYMQLVDHLIERGLEQRERSTGRQSAAVWELDWLRSGRDKWLDSAQEEDLLGMTPREVIEQERRRIPLVVPAAKHAIEDDCPLCQMMQSEPHGPVFWGLTPYDLMDDDDDPLECDAQIPEAPPLSGIWQRVRVSSDADSDLPGYAMFLVAACTGELIEDLKQTEADRHWIDALNRHVGNLTAALRGDEPSLLEPVISRFEETLTEIAGIHDKLTVKTEDLQAQLVKLVQLSQH